LKEAWTESKRIRRVIEQKKGLKGREGLKSGEKREKKICEKGTSYSKGEKNRKISVSSRSESKEKKRGKNSSATTLRRRGRRNKKPPNWGNSLERKKRDEAR